MERVDHAHPVANGTIRFGGPEHVAFNGTENDRLTSSEGDDTMRGNDGDDFMQGGDGNDNHIGGLGDDILNDLAGDDTLKGGDGDDALSSGQGFGGDLNQGGLGKDFIVGGNDITETFGGPGDDFVFAGDAEDTVFGDDGDDWIEGGKGPFNLLQGDNGAPFQDDPNEPGHDVLDGDGGEQDYDTEGGDDIMLAGPGIQRSEGMLGFDWVTHKNDPLAADSDMDFTGLLPPGVETNRDRFDLVEALSGWTGTTSSGRRPRGRRPRRSSTTLNQAGIDRITGAGAAARRHDVLQRRQHHHRWCRQRPHRGSWRRRHHQRRRLAEHATQRAPTRMDFATEIGSAEGMTKTVPGREHADPAARPCSPERSTRANIVIIREILSASTAPTRRCSPASRGLRHHLRTQRDHGDARSRRRHRRHGHHPERRAAAVRRRERSRCCSGRPRRSVAATAAGSGAANVSLTRPAANGTPAITGFEIVVSDGTVITGHPEHGHQLDGHRADQRDGVHLPGAGNQRGRGPARSRRRPTR